MGLSTTNAEALTNKINLKPATKAWIELKKSTYIESVERNVGKGEIVEVTFADARKLTLMGYAVAADAPKKSVEPVKGK